MFIKFKISCPCGCNYFINENISKDKLSCPNCGLEYKYSENVIKALKLLKEIPDCNPTSLETSIQVISLNEDMM